MKALNADPEFKARHVAGLRRHYGGDPDELPDYGRLEYELAREEGFGHADAMEIALDAVAMAGCAEAAA